MKEHTSGSETIGKVEGYVLLREAARFLGVKPSYLYEFSRPGSKNRIPSRRVGKYRFFVLSELRDWLESKAKKES